MTAPTLRRIRVHVSGYVDLETTDQLAEALDWVDRQLQRIAEQYGVELTPGRAVDVQVRAVDVEVKRPLEL